MRYIFWHKRCSNLFITFSGEKMKKYLLNYSLFLKSVLVVCLIALQTGCHTANTAVLKKNPSLKQVSIPKPVETKKQNLSMAKKLKNQPISEYILGPEDVVEISVLGHEELKMEVSISPTGKIPYYFIGDVQAAGLNQFQLRDNIQKEIAEFIKDCLLSNGENMFDNKIGSYWVRTQY